MSRLDGRVVVPADIAPLTVPLRARGPDAQDVWCSGCVGVGATLLDTGDARLRARVTRVAPGLVVAGQVRLDGRASLVARLRHASQQASELDADIVLFARAWATWDERALERLLGDFSVVVADEASGACTLVRDAFGVRMLFYSATADRIVVSNTLASVLAAPGVTRALDDDALADFIAVGLNENLAGTTFRDVKRVPAGHCLRFAPGRAPTLSTWWRLPERDVSSSSRDYSEHFRLALEESVHDRCRTSSVAVMMSGGLDSTSLATLARGAIPADGHVTAITVDFPTLAPSPEAEKAQLVASHGRLSHVVFDGDAWGIREGCDGEPWHTPEPYDEPDLALWRALLTTASASSRVLLYGEDPDAILATPQLGVRDTVRRMTSGASRGDAGPEWLRADLVARRAERLASREVEAHPTRGEVARRLGYPLWQTLLESLDAGQHGIPIDVRLPFLDRRVVESALAAPAIPWLQRKHLLREAMLGVLPDTVRLAPKRGLDGLWEARLAQWWGRAPRPFEPSERLRTLVNAGILPTVGAGSDPVDVSAHLRLRILDRWLREAAAD
jgi:asparagine synthase (glutamine-hydrolysing)